MKMQGKLFIISSISVLTIVFVLIAIVINQIPINNIQKEKSVLNELEKSIIDEKNVLAKFINYEYQLDIQYKKWLSERENTSSLFKKVENFTVLSGINDNLLKSLGSIINLKGLINARISTFKEKYNIVLEKINAIFGNTRGVISLFEIYNWSSNFSSNKDYVSLRYEADSFMKEIRFLLDGYDGANNVIEKQFTIVEREIDRFQDNILILTIIIISVLVAASFLLSFFISHSIVKKILNIENSVRKMAEGDISESIIITGKDEIAGLGIYINELNKNLSDAIKNLKEVSAKNLKTKDIVLEAMEETSSSTIEISANINSINHQMDNLSRELTSNVKSSDEIEKSVENLNDQIQDQSSMVEESAASITEMISSLKNLQNQSQLNNKNSVTLVKQTEHGSESLKNTISSISHIENMIGDVHKILKMINSIAAQTNMLAMNAAIEAAHAGDKGKGFGVVASEIRKLAESSTDNSKQITVILKNITNSIQTAAKSGQVTSGSFNEMNEYVKRVTNSFTELSMNMDELVTGGNEVLKAMGSLTQISQTTRTNSGNIYNNSKLARESIEKINMAATSVSEAISEISSGLSGISNSVIYVKNNSIELGDLTMELDKAINKFTLKK